MRIQVLVRLKGSVLDVQGKAIEGTLHRLGYENANHVRVGKLIELDVPTEDFDDAKEQAKLMCEKLLANTVIENFEIRKAE